MSLSFRDFLITLLIVLAWGVNFPVSKVALEAIQPFTLLFIRFIVSFSIIAPFFIKKLTGHQLFKIFVIMLFFTPMHIGTMYIAIEIGVSSAIGIIIQQLGAVFAIILAFFIFHERISLLSITGIIIAFIGTAITIYSPTGGQKTLALILMLFSAVSWGFYSVYVKKSGIDGVNIALYISLMSIPVSFILALCFHEFSYQNLSLMKQNINIKNAIAIIFVLFVPSLGQVFWCQMTSKYSVSSVAPILLLMPFFGVISSPLLTDDKITLNVAIGGIVMILGVALGFAQRPKKSLVKAEI